MTEIQHSERAHAKLSASSAARWIACPPSVQHSNPDTENRTSTFAEEGTAAHELSELYLAYELGHINEEEFNMHHGEFRETSTYYSEEMEQYVAQYVSYVMENVAAARAASPDALALIEQRLDYSIVAPGGFGTGDVVLVADGDLRVIDLKYGKGLRVDAPGNPQLRLYGVGALAKYDLLYDIDLVTTTIVQPRLDHISSETLTVEELEHWAHNTVAPAALDADAGRGEYNPGEHCHWCPIAATCRARAEQNLELAEFDFAEPATLSSEEIAEILQQTSDLKKWAGQVEDYALERARTGADKFPGWKVVEGRSNRRIIDEEAAVKKLRNRKLRLDQIYKPAQLRGLGELEKVLGKKRFEEAMDGLIEKPPGKPALVPESDNRKEWSAAAADFADEFDDADGLLD